MADSIEVTRRLKELRERAGLSVRAMAHLVGMSPSGYSHYETASRFKDAYLPMSVAIQIAKAVDGTAIDPSEILELAGSSAVLPADSPGKTGFAETAKPFEFKEHATDPQDPQRAWRTIFGKAAMTPATFELLHEHHGFGLFAGDVLICDMSRMPKPGELAIISFYDEEHASAVTLLRRYLPPHLVSCDITENPPLRVDEAGVTVRYPVIGSIRGIPK